MTDPHAGHGDSYQVVSHRRAPSTGELGLSLKPLHSALLFQFIMGPRETASRDEGDRL